MIQGGDPTGTGQGLVYLLYALFLLSDSYPQAENRYMVPPSQMNFISEFDLTIEVKSRVLI